MLPWLRLLIGLATVAVATPVLADWRTQSGLDVASGKASVLLIGELDQRTTFYASCIGGELALRVQSYDGRDDAPDVGVVRLTIRTDSGAAWASNATYGRTISGYLDATYEAIGDIPAIVSDLVAARTTISVGLEFEEAGESVWDGSAKGSTAAGRAFLDACGIAVPAASPARMPVTGSPAWALRVEPDPGTGSRQVVLSGDLGQGGYLYAVCDGARRPSLAFLSTNPVTFPYEAGDVGLMISVVVDGEERRSVGEYFARQDGLHGVAYTGAEYVPSLIEAVGGANSDVAITIESYSTGTTTRWPAKNLNGLEESIRGFNDYCFGGQPIPTIAAPSPPPATAQPDRIPGPVPSGVEWVVNTRPEADGTLSYTLVGEAFDGRGALLFACTSEGGIYLGFAAATEESPQRQVRAPMQLSVRLGDFTYDLEADVRASNDTATTVLSDDTGMAYVIADVLSWGMVAEIAVTVRDPRTGAKLLRRVGVGNAGPAAADFKAKCAATAG